MRMLLFLEREVLSRVPFPSTLLDAANEEDSTACSSDYQTCSYDQHDLPWSHGFLVV